MRYQGLDSNTQLIYLLFLVFFFYKRKVETSSVTKYLLRQNFSLYKLISVHIRPASKTLNVGVSHCQHRH